jgi:two-component system, NtrC family, response regulator HydG
MPIMDLKKANVLVVDDDEGILTALQFLLKNESAKITTEKNPNNLLALVTKQSFDLIVLDMNFNAAINTGKEGLYWLKRILEVKPDSCVALITAYADIDLAIKSLKEGASDFVIKPWKNTELLESFKSILAKKDAPKKTSTVERFDFSGIIGQSAAMQEIFYKLEKVAPTDANVLILGENGTGKDVFARALHLKSLRWQQTFVKVDVGALTETLFESELFGYKKGAFTGAQEDRDGRFEAASGGTLFLDEIGNISLHQQSKLLTVLQNRQVTRLGTHEAIPVDIRLICATNAPLSDLANEQKFRKDLMYRINTVEITIPPLRERKEDIIPLANYYLHYYGEKYFKSPLALSVKAIEKLKSYHFPGNVRELQYCMERCVILSENTEVQAEEILFSPIEQKKGLDIAKTSITNLNAVEKQTILHVIEKNHGNISRAAKELGITRNALYRRLGKYDI